MIDHILTWMTFFPLIGALVILVLPGRLRESFKWVAVATSAVPLALAVMLFLNFDTKLAAEVASLKTSAPSLDPVPYGLQFVDHWVWIRAFNIEYFVGVDGISMAMVVLTALVSFVATLSSVKIRKPVEPDHQSIAGIKVKERAYYALLLLLETGMMGVFVSLDLFLFYVFWELMLLPMYFLIGIWGGPRKEYAAIKFFL